ncbi:MAG: glycosyltransferase family 39 protein [Patescibacteria group bacterium]|nr:glycosyltransferase family 39 protein [Patescibacteria group bacterium]
MIKFRLFKNNFDYLLVLLLALVFFAASAWFNCATQSSDYVKFLSPDETANYFFAKHYAETGSISVFEPSNLIAEEIVHPRSVRSDNGWLKPVSFLGIILVYGQIASWLGTAVIPYLTPFFAALGIIFFYAFVRKLFGRQVAMISAFLLASFPVYFFYSARSMFHNVLFLVFLLAGAYFLLLSLPPRENNRRKFLTWRLSAKDGFTYSFSLLAGLMFGGAIGARSSELLWLGPALFIAWLFYARRLGLTRLVFMLAGLVLALLPVFYWNQILYSSPFFGGYGEMNRSIAAMSQAGGNFLQSSVRGDFSQYRSAIEVVLNNIFYFGYQPYQSLKMFFYYVLKMFPLLSAFTFVGFLIFIYRIIQRPKRGAYLYLLVWLALSLILVFYYGSWHFNDNPDPRRFTIGNSYTRYWLPMYVLAIPLASLFIVSLSRFIASVSWPRFDFSFRFRPRRFLSIGLMALIVGAAVFVNLDFVFFGSEEGLATLYHNHFIDKANAQAILGLTEEQAVIVTQYHDKQLFPERRVINALLTNDDVNGSLGKMLRFYPIYYYNFTFPEKDLIYLNERRLPQFGFNINPVVHRGQFTLYRLDKVEPLAEGK